MAFYLPLSFFVLAASIAGAWSAPVNLGADVNSAAHEINGNILSSQGTTYLYFSSDRTPGIGALDNYYTQSQTPPHFAGINLIPSPVNSTANDDGPAMRYAGPPSDNTLFFASDRAGGQGGFDIYTATLAGTLWGGVTPLPPAINAAGDDMYPFTAAFNGKTVMFFVRNAAIHISEYSGGAWQSPVPVNLGTGNSYHPCLVGSGEGAKLFFSSNRGGGMGAYDIWVATYSGGAWGSPVNLGAPVNTDAYEHSPAVSLDGEILYFASTRPGGYGGYDLWYARSNPAIESTSLGRVRASFK